MLRSWNSSRTMVRKSDASGSCCSRAVRMPSVASSTRVSRVKRRSKRTCQPTSPPSVQPCSSRDPPRDRARGDAPRLQHDHRPVGRQRRRHARRLAGARRGDDHRGARAPHVARRCDRGARRWEGKGGTLYGGLRATGYRAPGSRLRDELQSMRLRALGGTRVGLCFDQGAEARRNKLHGNRRRERDRGRG